MILTSLPDLPPRPETAANAAFRRRFYERWGRENAVVCGHAVRAEYAVLRQTLSLKMARGARERYFLDRREVVVDDDAWLLLDEGARYGSLLEAPGARAGWTFSVFLRPGLQHEVAAARQRTLAQALDDVHAPPRPVHFAEHLRAHGDAVSRLLVQLAAAVQAGERDELWLEERCQALVEALLDAQGEATHDEAASAGSGSPTRRAAQRAELRRRLRLAADFIASEYACALTLERMAEVACLSRYHFVREFRAAFGLSPCAFLAAKRARAARRWLAEGVSDREWVAQRCGFGSRFALARALARHPAS